MNWDNTVQSRLDIIRDRIQTFEVKGKTIGSDLNAVAEWSESSKFKDIATESTQGLIQKDLLMD